MVFRSIFLKAPEMFIWSGTPMKFINVFSFERESRHFVMKSCDCEQWRSQPDNLVPLCTFYRIIIINFFRN